MADCRPSTGRTGICTPSPAEIAPAAALVARQRHEVAVPPHGAAGDVGISADAIVKTQVPLLGVCLGHQCMAHLHGMEVVLAPKPMHGRVSVIHHDNQGVFKGLPHDLSVVRYHSLVVRELKEPWVLTAWGQDGVIHGIRHPERPLHGVQFHPESICTEAGMDLLRNFRDLAMAHKTQRSVS